MASPVHPYSDYGVALRTLRSARSWLALLLAFCVVMQLVGFALMRYTEQPYWSHKPMYELERPTNFRALNLRLNSATLPAGSGMGLPLKRPMTGPATAAATEPEANAATPATSQPTTAPATATETDYQPPLSAEGRRLNIRPQWNTTYVMAVAATQVGGLLTAGSQTLIVFLTLLLMLVAQAPGVAHVTRSLIWSVLLFFMVIPWQFFARDFPIPGVLYGYQELLGQVAPEVVGGPVAGFTHLQTLGRFVIYPLASLFFLLMMSERFRAGVMLAIGHPLQSIMQRPNLTGTMTPGNAAAPPTTLGSDKKKS